MAEASRLQVLVRHGSLSADLDEVRHLVQLVLERERANLEELTVVFADHATVRELNRRYLQHDYDTDVLAFDYADAAGVIDGEIYVDLDTALERHDEFGASFKTEYLRYAVHGLLHLLGYRDKSEAGKREMHELEEAHLQAAGLV